MEKLRKDDFIFCYWFIQGGATFWLIERRDEIFLQGLNPHTGWIMKHFPIESRAQINAMIEAVNFVLSMFGLPFNEFPVFADFSRATRAVSDLNAQFELYDKMKEESNAVPKQNETPELEKEKESKIIQM